MPETLHYIYIMAITNSSWMRVFMFATNDVGRIPSCSDLLANDTKGHVLIYESHDNVIYGVFHLRFTSSFYVLWKTDIQVI